MKYKTFLMAFFATIVQFYDYALFGLSAGILIANFMPQGHAESTKLLHFFGIFAFAVIARPIGALIFGYIGDKYARSTSIKLATLVAMISTTSIAFIPSFNNISYLSTILLIICRMLFLISQGGEVDLTRIYIAEKIGEYKNLANGLVSLCSQFGALLAAIAYHLFLSFENDYIWRLNFIIGGIAGFLVLLMRDSLEESELFLQYKARKSQVPPINLIKIISINKRNFLIATLCSGALGGGYNFLIIFLNIFSARILNLFTAAEAQLMNIILIASYGICAVISGFIADKIKSYWQIITAIILIYICYIILIIDVNQITYLSVIIVCLMAFYTVPLQIIIQSLFKIEYKARLCSLSHSIGGILLSSSIPFFSMVIWDNTNSFKMVLAIYLVLVSLLLIIILRFKKIFFVA